MAQPRITYNSKIITLGQEPLKSTFVYSASPPRTVNTTLAGETETITAPRCDVTIQGKFYVTDAETRDALSNWQQWMLQGNASTFAYDPDLTVSTTLNGGALVGDSLITLTSVTGVRAGGRYVLKDGPYHQAVTVESVSGSNVTIIGDLDNAFSSGCKFRDQYSINCEVRTPQDIRITDDFLHLPGHVTDKGVGPRSPWAWLEFNLFESTTTTGGMSGVTHVDNETPSGTIDGTNDTFDLAYTPVTNSVLLFYSAAGSGYWVLWNTTAEYTISGTTITTAFNPATGDRLKAWYRR